MPSSRDEDVPSVDELVDRLYIHHRSRFQEGRRPRRVPSHHQPLIPSNPPRPPRRTRPSVSTQATPPPRPRQSNRKTVTMSRRTFVIILGLLIASVIVAGRSRDSPGGEQRTQSQVQPGSTKTVTVTVTERVPELPASCRRALEIIPGVMADIAQLNGKANVQIDIAGEAHRAIQSKDWKTLDLIESKQAKLAQQHEDSFQHFKQSYAPLKEALAQCEKDTK